MKNIIIFLLGITLIGGGVWWWYSTHQTQKLSLLGVVDGRQTLGNVAADYRNEFHGWGPNSAEEVGKIVDRVKLTGSDIILTVEPWPLPPETALEMFDNIRKGRYDTLLDATCSPLKEFSRPILRWGHEVETVGSRYPWAVNEAQQFVSAYQYVVDYCRDLVPELKFMWSPAGLPGLEKYYPGDKYVDYVGLSIFGYPEYELKSFGSLQSFDQVTKPRYDRVLKYGKPVIIAELGCAGESAYKLGWLREAIRFMEDKVRYPYIQGFVLFSGSDPNPWIPGINAPDFTLNTEQVQTLFLDAKK